MTVIHRSDFTGGSDGDAVTSLTPTTGAALITGGPTTAFKYSNRAVDIGADSVIYGNVCNQTIPADQIVESTMKVVSTDHAAMQLYGRFVDINNTYFLYPETFGSGNIYIGKRVAGVDSFVQTIANTFVVGTDFTLILDIRNVAGDPVIKAYKNGVQIGTTWTDTGSTLTAAGTCGFILAVYGLAADQTNGFALDYFQVSNTSTPGVLFRPSMIFG